MEEAYRQVREVGALNGLALRLTADMFDFAVRRLHGAKSARRTMELHLTEFEDGTYGGSVLVQGSDIAYGVGNNADREGTIDALVDELKRRSPEEASTALTAADGSNRERDLRACDALLRQQLDPAGVLSSGITADARTETIIPALAALLARAARVEEKLDRLLALSGGKSD